MTTNTGHDHGGIPLSRRESTPVVEDPVLHPKTCASLALAPDPGDAAAPEKFLLAKLSRTDAAIHRAEIDNHDAWAAALDLWRAVLHVRVAVRRLRVRLLWCGLDVALVAFERLHLSRATVACLARLNRLHRDRLTSASSRERGAAK